MSELETILRQQDAFLAAAEPVVAGLADLARHDMPRDAKDVVERAIGVYANAIDVVKEAQRVTAGLATIGFPALPVIDADPQIIASLKRELQDAETAIAVFKQPLGAVEIVTVVGDEQP